MKNTILLASFLFTFLIHSSFGQQRILHQLPNFDKYELHWGFYIGLNQRSFNTSYKESNFSDTNVSFKNEFGFNVGLIGDMKINEHLNLRLEPGLFSNAGKIFFTGSGITSGVEKEIKSTYFHIPLLLKVSANRFDNIKPYIIGGVSYDYNFSSNQDNPNDNSQGEFRMQTSNFMYEVGIGMDIYFPYFKFSPSIRGLFAITNELTYDEVKNGPSPWTDPIDFMGTRGLFIRLAFE